MEKTTENIAITGLCETHWRNSGHFISSNNNLVICSSNENESKNGVAIIINKNIKEAVSGYEAVSDRIVTVRIHAQPVHLNFVQVYAPTSTATLQEIQELYGKLSETIDKIPNREIIIIAGDFNAKIGNTNGDDHLRNVVGKYGLGDRNERGNILLEFCTENKLYIANTRFQHHPRRLYTWRSPDGHTKNQIDFFLIKYRWISSIKDVKTYPAMDCGSDHNALIAEVCFRLKKSKTIHKLTRWSSANNDAYKDAVSVITSKTEHEEIQNATAQQLWNNMKHVMEVAAFKIKHKQQIRKKPWISDQTWIIIDKRQKLKSNGITNAHEGDLLQKLNKDISKRLSNDKNNYITSICDEIQKHAVQNEPRDLFQKVRTITGNFKPRHLPIKDETGKLLTNKNAVLNRWRKYCENLMSQ